VADAMTQKEVNPEENAATVADAMTQKEVNVNAADVADALTQKEVNVNPQKNAAAVISSRGRLRGDDSMPMILLHNRLLYP